MYQYHIGRNSSVGKVFGREIPSGNNRGYGHVLWRPRQHDGFSITCTILHLHNRNAFYSLPLAGAHWTLTGLRSDPIAIEFLYLIISGIYVHQPSKTGTITNAPVHSGVHLYARGAQM